MSITDEFRCNHPAGPTSVINNVYSCVSTGARVEFGDGECLLPLY